jgi:DNA-binding NarL/FixJ family response regulator
MARLLIADDHDVVICGLRQVFRTQDRWEIVAEAVDGKQAVAKAIEAKPDVAVIDHSLQEMNGAQVTREIRAHLPRTEILVFATYHCDAVLQECWSAGARGYLLKSDANRLIVAAVQALLARRPFISPQVPAEGPAIRALSCNRVAMPLTHRQRAIVQLIAEGHSNKTVAHALKISLKTVETHRASAMQRLNLTSSAALVRYAIRNHIIEA